VVKIPNPGIKNLPPSTGRIIQEDGDVVNFADVLYNSEGKQLFSNDNPAVVEVQSKFNGGIATGGSNTTIIDDAKSFEINMFSGNVVKVIVADIEYYRTVLSNTETTLTISSLPGSAASAILGTAGTAEVTVICANKGIGGNEYTAEIIEAPGTDDNLSASLIGLVLTIYLGKTGGVLDNTKNTATAVAAVIDQIPEFFATMTGSGGVIEVTVEPVSFNGGIAIVSVSVGCDYQINTDLSVLATSERQDTQTSALNDILEQLEMGNAPNILRNTGKMPPIGTVLGAGGTYESDVIDRPNQNIPVGQTRIWVYADQSGVLNLRESHNGINWTTTNTLAVSAGITNIMNWFKMTRRYAKVEYVNGGVAQTEFILLQYFLGVGVTLIKADDGDIVSIGLRADAPVINPALSASEIALLKGILSQLQGGGSGAAPVQLTGSTVEKAFSITPNDNADLTNNTIAIFVGSGGNLKIDTINGDTITMTNIAVGVWHPIKVKKVYAIGTTVTSVLGAY